MTREELDFIGSMNMCDEISNEAYKKIVCHCEGQEPCEDAISRQAVLEAIDVKAWEFCDYLISKNRNDEQKPVSHFADNLRECVREELPSVNPQPKLGHWIFDEILDKHYYCSECKSMGVDYWDYCPYCGARMLEPQESEDKQ